MYDHACMEAIYFDHFESLSSSKEWEPLVQRVSRTQLPSRSYSKRSAHMAELRSSVEWAAENADGLIRALSDEAFLAAKTFINSLPDACLDFRMGISMSGEVNFFFGSGEELFQVLIDESGMLSYYAKTFEEEFGDSDVRPEDFIYLKLLQFVDRKK